MKAKPSAAPSEEYKRFEDSLRKVLQVSHTEMQSRLSAAKQERQQQRKRSSAVSSASGRASRERV